MKASISDSTVEDLRKAMFGAACTVLYANRGNTLELWAALRLITRAIETNPDTENHRDLMAEFEARIPELLAKIEAEMGKP